MTTTIKIVKYELNDIVRSKWLLFYGVFFLLMTDALFRFGGNSAKVILSLMNVVLLIIPLMSIIFGVIYLYNAREFIEMMLSQPIKRRELFSGLYAGLALPLCAGFVAGVLLPFALHGVNDPSHVGTLGILLVSGVFLTLIFLALAFLIAIHFEDRVKGLGAAIVTYLLFSVIYDGAVLFAAYLFSDYPMEKPMIALSAFNPIDLARVLIMLKFDVAALMGYTGAVFERFFGGSGGIGISMVSLLLWATVPLWLGMRKFTKRDF